MMHSGILTLICELRHLARHLKLTVRAGTSFDQLFHQVDLEVVAYVCWWFVSDEVAELFSFVNSQDVQGQCLGKDVLVAVVDLLLLYERLLIPDLCEFNGQKNTR